jgi:Zn finger protein HypA/HybF involved in hydrogenase expression
VPGSVEGFTAARNGTWVCWCGTRLKTARAVVRHRDIAHLRPQPDGQYRCPLCSAKRVTMSALKAHYDANHMP